MKFKNHLIDRAVVAFAVCAMMANAAFAENWSRTNPFVRLTTQTDRVGIGMSNPGGSTKLHVTGPVAIGYGTSQNLAAGIGIAVTGNVGIGLTNPTNALQVNGSGAIGFGTSTFAAPSNGLAVYGNVGIGTTSPNVNLDVEATSATYAIYAKNSGSGPGIKGVTTSSTGVCGSSSSGFGVSGVSGSGNGVNGESGSGYGVYGSSTSSFAGYFSGNVYMSGNVGIGTTNAPGTNGKLLVNGGVAIGYSAAGTNPPQNGLVVFGTVAIGTTNPQANTALAVNGTIRSKEVIVTTAGWSDYVFEKNYTLKPLDKVEQYVKKNSHLEGIPSESEVKAGGIAVGEMQTKLLQKLEEVTLYLIEQNKKIELLTRENSELHNKLDKLTSH